MDHNAHSRRPQFHRGRRGADRRGSERRTTQQPQEQASRSSGDHVDVEQIMRDIRARISHRHGIDLTAQQIQELAARRLEAILDPRTMNPSLLEQLRRGAGTPPDIAPAEPDPGYSFDDTTLYDTHRGALRFIRRLLNPILKLFINPDPLASALSTQMRLNHEAAARESRRERAQAEWNALHYEILQRLVTEGARLSIEMQHLALRVESLSTKVDFNDRRVRSFENIGPQAKPQTRPAESARLPPPAPGHPAAPVPSAAAAPPLESSGESSTAAAGATEAPGSDVARRRRRRRRGRRSGTGAPEGTGYAADPAATGADSAGDAFEADEPGDDEHADPSPIVMEAAPAPVSAPAAADPQGHDPTPVPDGPAPPRDEPTTVAEDPDRSDPGPTDR